MLDANIFKEIFLDAEIIYGNRQTEDALLRKMKVFYLALSDRITDELLQKFWAAWRSQKKQMFTIPDAIEYADERDPRYKGQGKDPNPPEVIAARIKAKQRIPDNKLPPYGDNE